MPNTAVNPLSIYLKAKPKVKFQGPKRQINDRKTLLIICFVTFVACFDFTFFVFLSESLSLTFFEQSANEFSQQVKLAFLVAVGFIARPIGGLLMGRYGDIKGRKPALNTGLALLIATSLTLACLPTFAQVGVLASILLGCVRLIQGAAFANQLGLSWVYIVESLPRKKLSIYISIVSASFVFGGVACALLSAWLKYVFTPEQLIEYAWRLPFLLSALLSMVGYHFVRKLDESGMFTADKMTDDEVSELSNFSHSLNRFNAIFFTAFLSLVYASSMIMSLLLLPELINNEVSMNSSTLNIISVSGAAFMAIGMLFYGWLAHKLDVGRALMFGSIFLCIQTFILYYYLNSGSGMYLIPIYAMVGFSYGLVSLCPMIFLQLFPTRNRLTAINLIFNTMTVFTGVVLPFSVLYITELLSFAPALYMMFIGICAFFMGFYVYQTPQLLAYQNNNTHSDPSLRPNFISNLKTAG